jgi:hypothetical protein
MCFLVIWISSFEKVLFCSLAHFFIGSLILGECSFWVPYIFWLSVLCLMCSWQIFSPTLWWFLQFRDHLFCWAEIFSFMMSHLSMLSLSCWAAGVPLRKFLPIHISSKVFLTLSCTNFRVCSLILRSLINFELIFLKGDEHWSSFSFLQNANQFSQQFLLKRLSFLHYIFLAPLSKTSWL